MSRRNRTALAPCLVLIALPFVGCERAPTTNAPPGNMASSDRELSTDNTNADAAPSPTAASLGEIEVRLTEFEIGMPMTVNAGPTTFSVTNAGDALHNFEIEGQGIEKEFESPLKPGETRTMQVELKPGAYKIYCPVGNHEARGMTMQLAVK